MTTCLVDLRSLNDQIEAAKEKLENHEVLTNDQEVINADEVDDIYNSIAIKERIETSIEELTHKKLKLENTLINIFRHVGAKRVTYKAPGIDNTTYVTLVKREVSFIHGVPEELDQVKEYYLTFS